MGITCRRAENGGRSVGSVSRRLEGLDRADMAVEKLVLDRTSFAAGSPHSEVPSTQALAYSLAAWLPGVWLASAAESEVQQACMAIESFTVLWSWTCIVPRCARKSAYGAAAEISCIHTRSSGPSLDTVSAGRRIADSICAHNDDDHRFHPGRPDGRSSSPCRYQCPMSHYHWHSHRHSFAYEFCQTILPNLLIAPYSVATSL